jgi:transcriptional regulator of arginine metabolism
MFAKSCIDAAYSMNTVIIKCYAGMASSVCVALEQLFNDIILGSLAGDDTIFAITSGEKDSVALVEKIKKLI